MIEIKEATDGLANQIASVAVCGSVIDRIEGLHSAFSAHGINITVINDLTDDIASIDCRLFIISNDDTDADAVLAIRMLVNSPGRPGIIVIGRFDNYLARILALEVGADSYLAESARPLEVVAQARAIIRRMSPCFSVDSPLKRSAVEFSSKFRFNDWIFDTNSLKLSAPSGENVFITSTEVRLLAHFIRYSGVPQTRDELSAVISGSKENYSLRSIDVSISRLKHKFVKKQRDCSIIRSVRGQGYVFAANVEAV